MHVPTYVPNPPAGGRGRDVRGGHAERPRKGGVGVGRLVNVMLRLQSSPFACWVASRARGDWACSVHLATWTVVSWYWKHTTGGEAGNNEDSVS